MVGDIKSIICIGQLFVLMTTVLPGQQARVFESLEDIPTYPYSDPNPITTLTSNAGIYPYHKFDGYSHKAVVKKWKVVKLENDYIEVYILPEIGGKVWGAVEKSTGKDFIYKNDVIKFRNIALRGPWTSGGIEFNFGIIGHTPSTATPVDYVIGEDDNGGVFCTVGMMDLPSRTQWRVTISLAKDNAYFTTKATWYNPTALSHPYYNWMTAAAKTSEDLVFYYPGDRSLQHSGATSEWPVNQDGRQLWRYRENDFASNKSYHVVGKYHNFFGGYWENEDFGFGHSGRHETMPGQKLWLWSLARDGGIWEDLLTDENGQYMEFQAGRLLNQYFNDDIDNPITEMSFEPHLTDQWEERWFPVKQIGGITAVGDKATLHVVRQSDSINLKFNALSSIKDSLEIRIDGEVVLQSALDLGPMDVYNVRVVQDGSLSVSIGDEMLYSDQLDNKKILKRPFSRDKDKTIRPAYTHYLLGSELAKRRKYREAKSLLYKSLKTEPSYTGARNLLAEIYNRHGVYDSALYHAQYVLQYDMYDFDANYLAGLAYEAMDDPFNALDVLGLASRSMKYRSAAYTEMAQIALAANRLDRAVSDAMYALKFNVDNIAALQLLTIAHRLRGDILSASIAIQRTIALDPLSHFARFEKYLISKKTADLDDFKNRINNEFAFQSHLEIASIYINAGLYESAIEVLQVSPRHSLTELWLAYCHEKINRPFDAYLNRALTFQAEFVFPYRLESLIILKWANEKADSWKLKYFLGLNYWAHDRLAEAVEWFVLAGNLADIPSFYVTRSELLASYNGQDRLPDLLKAFELGEDDWRYHHEIVRYYEDQGRYPDQLSQTLRAYGLFPHHHVIGLDHAQALVNNKQYGRSLEVLQNLEVLPSEGSFSGRAIYGKASLLGALEYVHLGKYPEAKEILKLSYLYPENLGSGRPFDPDERKIDFLMAYIEDKLGIDPGPRYEKIAAFENNDHSKYSIFNLYALEALGENSRKLNLLREIEADRDPEALWVEYRWKNKLPPLELIMALTTN